MRGNLYSSEQFVFEVFNRGHIWQMSKSLKFVLPLNYMQVDYDG
jgi:hypothetical protein